MMAQAAGRPDEFMATQALAIMQQFDGKYASASSTIQQAFEQAGRAKAPDVQAAVLLLNQQGRGLAELCEGNEAAVQQALTLDKSKITRAYAVFAAGVCGNGKLVLSLTQDLSRNFPDDTIIQDVYLPLARGSGRRPAGQALLRKFPGLLSAGSCLPPIA
jgi:hypothetical protein